jgi:proteasome accessory factor C
LDLVQKAASARRRVEVDYYSYGRDAWSRRVIEPARVFNSAGHWYVASGDRLFRIDRMRDPELLDSRFRRPKRAPASVYNPRKTDPLVVLDLPPSGRWVAEQYPVETVEEAARGRLRVALRWSERAWLERLMLRLGPGAKVIEGDRTVRRAAARRLLARYSVAPS